MQADARNRIQLSHRLLRSLYVILPTTLLSAGPAAAQLPDTSNWTCQRCPFRTGQEAEYSVGTSYVSDDSAHFGDATGYDEQGGYLDFDAAGSLRDDGGQLRWYVEDLGLGSRALGIEGGRDGRRAYAVEYRALPRRQFDTTETVFSPAGSDALKLPNDWARAGTTAGFDALESNLISRDIESDRETMNVGGRFSPTNRADVYADYRHTRRDGSNVQGAAYYTNASLLPRPFEHSTDELEVGARFRGERSNAELAYFGSFFDEESLKLNWQNPFASAAGAETAELARPPDSSFQQLRVSGRLRPGRSATFTYSAATGLMEQDSAFLDYTTNASLSTPALPRTSLDGRAVTRNLGLTASFRPHDRVRLKAAYRLDERDDRTPVEQWARVVAETFDSGELIENTPYGFERRALSLRADYDVGRRVRLSAGYEGREVDRDNQEVARQDEAVGWGQLSWRPNAHVDLRARAGTAKREIDEYRTDLTQGVAQNPLMRKYHLAYRFREFTELTVATSLPNRPISLGGTLRLADDSYTQSELGLLGGYDRRLALDFTWSFAQSSSVYVLLALDRVDSEQAGSERFASADWHADIADEFRSVSAGVSSVALSERLSFAIDYTHGRAKSATEVAAAGEPPDPFPDLGTRLDSFSVRFAYEVSERLRGSLELRYQGLEAQDWALQGVEAATLPNVLALGAKPYDYDVLLIGLGVRYSPGD